MKKSAYLVNIAVAVAVMRFAGGAYAADFGDLAVNASDLKASAESQDVRRPGDGHGGPGEHHDGPGPNHVCPPAPFAPSDRDYNIEGTEADCRVLNISAQSPNTYTIKLQAKQVGTYTSYLVVARTDFWGCINGYERTEAGSGPYETTYGHGREITVEVGPRVLAAGETEQLNVCLTPEYNTTVDTANMLYEYKVVEENTSTFFKKASKFTLTPGARKQAPAAGKSMADAIKALNKGGLHNCDFYYEQQGCQNADGCHWAGDWDGSHGTCEEAAQNCDWYNDQNSCRSAGCYWHEDFYSRGCSN